MKISFVYIISQIFTIIMYILLGITYQVKSRKKILILSILSNTFQGIAYILLKANSGFLMCILAIVRDVTTIIINIKIKDNKIKKRANLCTIILCYIAIIISAIFTYEGLFSMFSIIATMLYTYSIWQQNKKVYAILGTPIGICWIIYNIYVKSIFGVILEASILLSSIIGFIRKNKSECK
ncbi:MAG: YgjV family protein [Clostridia bacterium]|nr:YgjV family protein [Clostridia bacterium]